MIISIYTSSSYNIVNYPVLLYYKAGYSRLVDNINIYPSYIVNYTVLLYYGVGYSRLDDNINIYVF